MISKEQSASIGVVPGGQMGGGIALAVARRNHEVTIYKPEPDSIRRFHRDHVVDVPDQTEYPANVRVTYSLRDAVERAAILFLAPASQRFEELASEVLPYLKPDCIVVTATKGLAGNGRRMSEMLDTTLTYRSAVMSGPNLSSGLERGDITGTVIASYAPEVSAYLQDVLSTPEFSIETEEDVVGVELGGAFKNLVALYAGMFDEMAVPANTKATYLTRLVGELVEIAKKQGAESDTFTGLSWLRDILLCYTDNNSRNHRAGEYLVQQPGSADEFLSGRKLWLAEGVHTIKPTIALARSCNLGINDTPNLNLIYGIVHEEQDPRKVINELMLKPMIEHRKLRSPRFHADRVVKRVGYMVQVVSRILSRSFSTQ